MMPSASVNFGALIFRQKEGKAPQSFRLKPGVTTIGTHLSCDIRLTKVLNHALCSVEVKDTGVAVLENKSKEPVMYKHSLLSKTQVLKNGDEFSFMGKTFQYQNVSATKPVDSRQSVMPNFKVKTTTRIPVPSKSASTRRSLSVTKLTPSTAKLCSSVSPKRKNLNYDWKSSKTDVKATTSSRKSISLSVEVRKSLFLKNKNANFGHPSTTVEKNEKKSVTIEPQQSSKRRRESSFGPNMKRFKQTTEINISVSELGEEDEDTAPVNLEDESPLSFINDLSADASESDVENSLSKALKTLNNSVDDLIELNKSKQFASRPTRSDSLLMSATEKTEDVENLEKTGEVLSELDKADDLSREEIDSKTTLGTSGTLSANKEQSSENQSEVIHLDSSSELIESQEANSSELNVETTELKEAKDDISTLMQTPAGTWRPVRHCPSTFKKAPLLQSTPIPSKNTDSSVLNDSINQSRNEDIVYTISEVDESLAENESVQEIQPSSFYSAANASKTPNNRPRRNIRTPSRYTEDSVNLSGVKALMKTPGKSAESTAKTPRSVKSKRAVSVEDSRINVAESKENKSVRKTRKIKQQQSPLNDLSNVSGVKSLMKTPGKTPRSVKKVDKSQSELVEDVSETEELDSPLSVKIEEKTPARRGSTRNMKKTPARAPRVTEESPLNQSEDEELMSPLNVSGATKTPRSVKKSVSESQVEAVEETNVKTPAKTPRRNVKSRKEQKSPLNDLSNVSGLSALMKTPKSVEKVNTLQSESTFIENSPLNMSEGKELQSSLNVSGGTRISRSLTKSLSESQIKESNVGEIANVKTPRNSSVKKTKARKEQKLPLNDLSNVSGVSALMKTPQTAEKMDKSLESSLNVSAVKKTPHSVKKSPEHSSDVEEKSTPAKTPLRSARKSVRAHKEQKSPLNDLSNVSGVGALLKTPQSIEKMDNLQIESSVVEDPELESSLEVNGVKKTPRSVKKSLEDSSDVEEKSTPAKTPLGSARKSARAHKEQKSPLNDLSNVSGVSALMKTPQSIEKMDKLQIESTVVQDAELASSPNVSAVEKTSQSVKKSLEDLSDVEEKSTPAKTLLRSARKSVRARKEQKSPLNDLSNVSGVSSLMKTPHSMEEVNKSSNLVEEMSESEELNSSLNDSNVSRKKKTPRSARKSLRNSQIKNSSNVEVLERTFTNNESPLSNVKTPGKTPQSAKKMKAQNESDSAINMNETEEMKSPLKDMNISEENKAPGKTPQSVKKSLNESQIKQKTPVKTPEVSHETQENANGRTLRSMKTPGSSVKKISLSQKSRIIKKQKSPLNDLCNVSGVSSLLKTPSPVKRMSKSAKSSAKANTTLNSRRTLKTNKSLRNEFNYLNADNLNQNDLTVLYNERGVAKVSTPRPKIAAPATNSAEKLTKKPLKIQKSPLNDLTNVSGVRQLMKTPKIQKQPKNDLSDVEGVKELFEGNDLKSSRRRVRFDQPITDTTPEVVPTMRTRSRRNKAAVESNVSDSNLDHDKEKENERIVETRKMRVRKNTKTVVDDEVKPSTTRSRKRQSDEGEKLVEKPAAKRSKDKEQNGNKVEVDEPAAAPRRGRRKAAVNAETVVSPKVTRSKAKENETVKKSRGRKPKVVEEVTSANNEEQETVPVAKRRGRRAKVEEVVDEGKEEEATTSKRRKADPEKSTKGRKKQEASDENSGRTYNTRRGGRR